MAETQGTPGDNLHRNTIAERIPSEVFVVRSEWTNEGFLGYHHTLATFATMREAVKYAEANVEEMARLTSGEFTRAERDLKYDLFFGEFESAEMCVEEDGNREWIVSWGGTYVMKYRVEKSRVYRQASRAVVEAFSKAMFDEITLLKES